MHSFHEKISLTNKTLNRQSVSTVQINLGRLCNQSCHHCHVEAGPKRTEIMTKDTMIQLLDIISSSSSVQLVDLTGGAPEMNPHFRFLVESLNDLNIKMIDRCNLTILYEPLYEWIPDFLKKNAMHIVASLPCYASDNVDAQRGNGTFNKSIKALKKLNDLGYGVDGGNLNLDLVYNPSGPFLPPEQSQLEQEYKRRLFEDFGIYFNNLLTITNMPIKRFKHQLEREGGLNEYYQLLYKSFNQASIDNLMCRSMVSVDWQGAFYDCDFNQMLDISLLDKQNSIYKIKSFDEITSTIATAKHCFGCTAGAGSSCGGSLI